MALYANPVLSGLSGLNEGIRAGLDREQNRLYAQQQAEVQAREQAMREKTLGLQYQMQEANLAEKQRQVSQDEVTRTILEGSNDILLGNYGAAKERFSGVGAQIEDIKPDPDYDKGILIKFAGQPEYVGHDKENFANVMLQRANPKAAVEAFKMATANTYKVGQKKIEAEQKAALQMQKDEAAMARKILDGEQKLDVQRLRNAMKAAGGGAGGGGNSVFMQKVRMGTETYMKEGHPEDRAKAMAYADAMNKNLKEGDILRLQVSGLKAIIANGSMQDAKTAMAKVNEIIGEVGEKRAQKMGATAPKAQGGAVTPRTQQEYDALPKGALYIRNGKIYRKN